MALEQRTARNVAFRVKRFGLLLLAALTLGGCGTDKGAVTQQGVLSRGTMALINTQGKIEAYPPANNEPKDQYTIVATAASGDAPTVVQYDAESRTLTACPGTRAKLPLQCMPAPAGTRIDYLVRVPKDVRAYLATTNGDIHVSDVGGAVDARTVNGDIKIQVPSYANAQTVNGNVSVTFGDVNWPGTLHFSSTKGDVEVYVPAIANAHVDLHTDHGTVYTDFDLHGSSQGDAETIVGNIGTPGANRGVQVRVINGSIRLLKLVPQM